MGEDKPKVLVVDDEPENLEYLRRVLERKYLLFAAASGQEGLELIKRERFCVIISDQRMPGMSGVELLTQVKAVTPDAMRIILTGYADLDDTIDAINLAGVTAFIRKPVKAEEIQQAVGSALDLYQLRSKNALLMRALENKNRELAESHRLLALDLDDKAKEILRINQRLEELVVRDGLTGLYNHRYFQERAEQEVSRARRYGSHLSLVFFDLDHFKIYNDANGHPQGDRALVTISEVLQHQSRASDVIAHIRGTDIVARYGGEEFVVLLPETPPAGAFVMADRIRQAIARTPLPGSKGDSETHLTISGGVAGFPADASTRTELIERADEALYRAKTSGRNRVCTFSPVERSAQPG